MVRLARSGSSSQSMLVLAPPLVLLSEFSAASGFTVIPTPSSLAANTDLGVDGVSTSAHTHVDEGIRVGSGEHLRRVQQMSI